MYSPSYSCSAGAGDLTAHDSPCVLQIVSGGTVSVELGRDYVYYPPVSRGVWANYSGREAEDLVGSILPFAKRNRNSRGCDFFDGDLRIAIEVGYRNSGYSTKRDLLREVVRKLEPYLDRGFHCIYVFANGYKRKDFLDVCSYLNSFGIKVISLEPVPRSELEGEFQFSQQEVDEWRYFALQELRGKLLRELVKIYPPRRPTSMHSSPDGPYTWRSSDRPDRSTPTMVRPSMKAQPISWKDEGPPEQVEGVHSEDGLPRVEYIHQTPLSLFS
jgi:hypothetical protein